MDLADYQDTAEPEAALLDYAEDGLAGNALLIALTLAGVAADKPLSRVLGSTGYGPVVGLLAGNIVSSGVSAYPQGVLPTTAAVAGALVPAVPLGVTLALKKKPEGAVRYVLLGSTAALVGLGYFWSRRKRRVQ